MSDALSIFHEAKTKINSIRGKIGAFLKAKMKLVVLKNPGLNTLERVGQALGGIKQSLPHGMGPRLLPN